MHLPMALRRRQLQTCWWSPVGEAIIGQRSQDQFGFATDISDNGQTIVVGAPYHDVYGLAINDESGSFTAYSLRENSTTWDPLGSPIVGDSPLELLGYAVALSGDGRVMASARNDGSAGVARVYQLQPVNDSNTLEWKQLGSDITGDTDGFGFALRLSADGRALVVGAPSFNTGNSDFVDIYELRDGDWKRKGSRIVSSQSKDNFGYAVDISADGETVAVGSPGSDALFPDGGQAQVFRFNRQIGNWEQFGSSIHGERKQHRMGAAVSISSDGLTVAAGAFSSLDVGAVVVHGFDPGSLRWERLGGGLQANGSFGYAVSLSGDGKSVAVGSPTFAVEENDVGRTSVYEYIASENAWGSRGEVFGEFDDDLFGAAVSLSKDGQRLLVGAPGRSVNGPKTGQAQVFELIGSCQLILPGQATNWTLWGSIIGSGSVFVVFLIVLAYFVRHFLRTRVKDWKTEKSFQRKDEDIKDIDVFISHYGRDTKESIARVLHYTLEELNVTSFFDHKTIKTGKVPEREIAKGLYGCRVGLVIITDNFLKSPWCRRELKTLHERSQDANDACILVPCFQSMRLIDEVPEFRELKKCTSAIVRTSGVADWHHLVHEVIPRVQSSLKDKELKHYEREENIRRIMLALERAKKNQDVTIFPGLRSEQYATDTPQDGIRDHNGVNEAK